MPDYKNDIEKYLGGKLSNAERHQLEKKALSDPFLAEALEGAESLTHSEFSHDLDEMNQKINIQKRNSLFWPLRIAAGIIVIVSITMITIQLTKNDTRNQLALQKQNSPTESPASPKEAYDDLAKESPAPNAEPQTPARENRRALPNQPVTTEKQQASAEEPRPSAGALSSPSLTPERDLAESVVTEEVIEEKIKEQETESSKTAGYEDKKEVLSQSKNDRAAAPSATRSLALSKKSEASGAGIKDEAESITTSESLPAGGMTQFNKYVEDNLRYPQRAIENNIQGDVTLEFQIRANGTHHNFEIIKSIGYGCDEEAIRLIKEGPMWNPAIQNGKVINSKVRIVIPFRIKKVSNK